MRTIKTNHENFVRDINTGAVLNTNKEAYDAYKKQRTKLLNKDREIDNLKSEMNELRQLVTQLLNKA